MDAPGEPLPPSTLDPVKLQIVRAALRLGEQAGSWDAVHVHAVAREVGLTFGELRRHFSDKDAIAEGYFDIAEAALLAAADHPGWRDLPVRVRVLRTMWAWFEALAPHRRLAREMIGYKFKPEHVHLQARGIMRISNTVQWVREVSQMPSIGWRREVEEAVLTTIFVTTFAYWLSDTSEDAQRTRRSLERRLARAEQGALWLGFGT